MLWIFFIENAEIKYHRGCILLKLVINGRAVNLFKIDKCGFFLIENAEITYQWGFILLKKLIKASSVTLLKTQNSLGFISLKILK